jgi:hypothetical protein
MTDMHDRSQSGRRWMESLSQRGIAWGRALIGIVVLVALVMLVARLFPTREERLWKFVDGARAAFVENREEDFLAAFDPAVRYQKDGGLADVRRELKRYVKAGYPPPNIAKREAVFDATGADVRLDVVVSVELRPIAQAKVRLRIDDVDGPWRVTSVAWE